MIDYVAKLYREVCSFFDPLYEDKNLERFDEFKNSGILERTSISEFERLFRIRGISSEF